MSSNLSIAAGGKCPRVPHENGNPKKVDPHKAEEERKKNEEEDEKKLEEDAEKAIDAEDGIGPIQGPPADAAPQPAPSTGDQNK